MRTLLLVLTASLALSPPRIAEACSIPACTQGFFVPAGIHSQAPANIPGLYWRPMRSYEDIGDPKNVVLTNVADPGTPLAFTVQPMTGGDLLIVPSAPLVPGERYLISDRNQCEITHQLGPDDTFTVGPAAPLPTDLGTLSVISAGIEQMSLAVHDGSCSSNAVVAQTSIQVEPSAAAAPWMDALHFQTFVDGKPWSYESIITQPPPPGASEMGRARDRVYEICSSDNALLTPTGSGLTPGKHIVTVRATLPGSSQVATSSPLEVKLDCNGVSEPGTTTSPAGCSTTGPGAAPWLALALLALRRRRSAMIANCVPRHQN